jgi:hypothetical protein
MLQHAGWLCLRQALSPFRKAGSTACTLDAGTLTCVLLGTLPLLVHAATLWTLLVLVKSGQGRRLVHLHASLLSRCAAQDHPYKACAASRVRRVGCELTQVGFSTMCVLLRASKLVVCTTH